MSDLERGPLYEFPRGVYVKLACGCIVARTSAQTVDKPAWWEKASASHNARWKREHRRVVHVRVVVMCKNSIARKRFVGKKKKGATYTSDLQPDSKAKGPTCRVSRSSATRQFYVNYLEMSDIIDDQLEMELHASFSRRKKR